MSSIKSLGGPRFTNTIHSVILKKIKVKGTPTYAFAFNRLLALGLTPDEAKALLKG